MNRTRIYGWLVILFFADAVFAWYRAIRGREGWMEIAVVVSIATVFIGWYYLQLRRKGSNQ